jgi:hypothetical protein
VPGGLISVERENLDSTDNESGWSESGEQCWTETHASSASTVWRFESPTESVELWSLGRSDQEVDGDCPEDGVDPTADPEGDEPLDGEEPEE